LRNRREMVSNKRGENQTVSDSPYIWRWNGRLGLRRRRKKGDQCGMKWGLERELKES